MTTTTRETYSPASVTTLPLRRAPGRDVLVLEASLRGDHVTVEMSLHQACDQEQISERTQIITTERRSSGLVVALEGIGATLAAAVVVIGVSSNRRGCRDVEGSPCGDMAIAFGTPLMLVMGSATAIDLLAEGTTTRRYPSSSRTILPFRCAEVPVEGQRIEFFLASGRRFEATTGDEGRATLWLGEEGLRQLREHDGRIELWLNGKPFKLLRLETGASR